LPQLAGRSRNRPNKIPRQNRAVPFAPLHTYYISPTGKDYNTGTSPGAAWATPHHAVNCGDVIARTAGAPFQIALQRAVESTATAAVICAGPYVTSCSVNGGAYEAFRVDESNWAVEGFSATQYSTANGASESDTTLHHIAFINDIAINCRLAGFDVSGVYGPHRRSACGGIAWHLSRPSERHYVRH
jgi:hypothetical protein